jgi:nucleotide-binding universal stress UspA family protein
VAENASDLIVLGWPGYTNTSGRAFGSVIDKIVDNPPTDIAVVRYRKFRPLKSILVPVAGGPNSRRAVQMAADMAAQSKDGPVKVTALRIIREDATEADQVRAQKDLARSVEGILYDEINLKMAPGNDVVETILNTAEDYELLIIGATNEPFFNTLLIGSIPERIAREARVTTIMVKRRHDPLRAMLRETVLEPASQKGSS